MTHDYVRSWYVQDIQWVDSFSYKVDHRADQTEIEFFIMLSTWVGQHVIRKEDKRPSMQFYYSMHTCLHQNIKARENAEKIPNDSMRVCKERFIGWKAYTAYGTARQVSTTSMSMHLKNNYW